MPPLTRPLFLRSYATTTSPSDPYRWPTHSHPTPYDILDHPPHAAYTKSRYAELVKLYHPDLFAHCTHHICPPSTRVDRFRLVVAANTLLSDPRKKRLYDTYGVGWPAPPRVSNHPTRSGAGAGARGGGGGRGGGGAYTFTSNPQARTHWRTGGRWDASRNATWEDWRTYHHPANSSQQRELHTRNGVFVCIVLSLAALGSWAELGYANSVGERIVEASEKKSGDLGRDVMRRRKEARESGDREERVRRFLEVRDPVDAMRRTGRRGFEGDGEKMILPVPVSVQREQVERGGGGGS